MDSKDRTYGMTDRHLTIIGKQWGVGYHKVGMRVDSFNFDLAVGGTLTIALDPRQ